MRINTPKFQSKKEMFSYLKENKQTLIEQKKSMPIYSDCVNFGSTRIKVGGVAKANKPVDGDMDTLRVKVIANTANWIDSHNDLLIPGSWNKTISERKGIIPHLHDHIHQIGAKVGEVHDIFSSNFSFAELGIAGKGNTEALVFITDIIKSYNEKVFNQYKRGMINQHSIGLQYMKLDLAINDESSTKEFEYWEKFYPQVINKSAADESGFFWVVQEIKLIENSAVLFGANEITPTLDNNLGKNIEPINFTQQVEPLKSTQNKNNNLRNNLLI
jgi:hypothetical protein